MRGQVYMLTAKQTPTRGFRCCVVNVTLKVTSGWLSGELDERFI